MVLVDTGVWIDFLAGRKTSEVETLLTLLDREEAIAFTPVILQELMQGCADDTAAAAIERHFESFIEIIPDRTTWRLAARVFRECRQAGYTIRSSVDCLIAACALEHDCSVHHKDRDFDIIERICGLRILRFED